MLFSDKYTKSLYDPCVYFRKLPSGDFSQWLSDITCHHTTLKDLKGSHIFSFYHNKRAFVNSQNSTFSWKLIFIGVKGAQRK